MQTFKTFLENNDLELSGWLTQRPEPPPPDWFPVDPKKEPAIAEQIKKLTDGLDREKKNRALFELYTSTEDKDIKNYVYKTLQKMGYAIF